LAEAFVAEPARAGRAPKTERFIATGLMVIDPRRETFDLKQIQNRRFMFNPKTHELVLGEQRSSRDMIDESHAHELLAAGVKGQDGDFVRGWIGTNKREFKQGIIHFAPPIRTEEPERFEQGFKTLEVFLANGGGPKTIIRGFSAPGDPASWEQPASRLIPGLDD
jgi:hypothetical protein